MCWLILVLQCIVLSCGMFYHFWLTCYLCCCSLIYCMSCDYWNPLLTAVTFVICRKWWEDKSSSAIGIARIFSGKGALILTQNWIFYARIFSGKGALFLTKNRMTFFSHHLFRGHMRYILPPPTFLSHLWGVQLVKFTPFLPHFNKNCLEKKFSVVLGVHLHPLATPMSSAVWKAAKISHHTVKIHSHYRIKHSLFRIPLDHMRCHFIVMKIDKRIQSAVAIKACLSPQVLPPIS